MKIVIMLLGPLGTIVKVQYRVSYFLQVKFMGLEFCGIIVGATGPRRRVWLSFIAIALVRANAI